MRATTHTEYMRRLKLDAEEVASRRQYFDVRQEDLERLLELRPLVVRHMPDMVDGFYRLLLDHPRTREFLQDPALVARLKRAQERYFLGLFDGRCDLPYVEDRLRVGFIHEQVGLPLKWYLGAYNRYLELTAVAFRAELSPEDALAAQTSLRKLVFFDTALAVDTYVAAHTETVARHRAAVEELSTPVIRVFDRVLLLPLVGTIDSARAQSIMERVLKRVSEQEAKVMIIDIAGVAVVDTQVADHLLRATAAVRLLGATTILTGISPQVARTVVELGVDITAMHTRSRLGDGIELALSLLGRRIVAGNA
jgi:rsbT co-antagonist protein RsbR